MKIIEDIKKCKRIAFGPMTEDGFSGMIYMPLWEGSIIVSWGAGWEHCSVAPMKSRITPSWDDMCAIKDMIWGEDEWVCQFHPPKSEYVSNVCNCLHLWKPTRQDMVIPPSCLVGIRKGQTVAELKKELSELVF